MGFTLAEILVAITIFMIVSSAMVGILSTSVDLYRRGEQARSANDEAMITVGRIEADLSRMIAHKDGGRIFARAGRLADNGTDEEFEGFDTIGFLVQSEEELTKRDFIVWITTGNGPKRSLERRVFEDIDDQFLNDEFALFSDPATPPETVNGKTVSSTIITTGCLHFGVGLMGTANLNAPTNSNYIYDGPGTSDPYWTKADPVVDADWYPDSQIYTSLPTVTTVNGVNQWQPSILQHPSAIRLTLILAGTNSDRPPLRLRTDVGPGETRIPLIGPGAVEYQTGSILRIGDELIGYHTASGKTIEVNSSSNHGPLRWTLTGGTEEGRGIYRSTPTNHNRGALVYMGEQFSIIRALP